MSPQLPDDEQYWDPVDLVAWQHHYGVTDALHLLLNLRRDYPDAQYRMSDGQIDVLVDQYDEEDTMNEHDELAAIIRTHLCTRTLGQVPIEELIELIRYVEQQRREATTREEGQ